jgi:hypothetical protein
MAQLDADVAAPTARERRLWTRLAAFTPSGAFFDAASRLAGTGLPTTQRWEQAVRDRQRFLETQLFDHPPNVNVRVPDPVGMLLQVKFGPLAESAALRTPVQIESSLRTSASEARWPLGVLAGYVVGLVTLAFAIFPRIRY